MTCTCGDRPEHVHHVRRPHPKVGAGRNYGIRAAMAMDAHNHATWCGAPITDTDLGNHQARHKNARRIACPACLEAFDTPKAVAS